MAPHEDEQPHRAIALHALMDQDQFLVADELGDIEGGADGLFRADTRVLSRFQLRIGRAAPSLLASGVTQDNVLFRAHVTNRPLPMLGGSITPEGVIHIERTRLLWNGRMHERLVLTSYGSRDVQVPLAFAFAADFADIFEVRGQVRVARGRTLPPRYVTHGVVLAYEGLDARVRTTSILFSRPPTRLAAGAAEFDDILHAHERRELFVEVGPEPGKQPDCARFRRAAACARWSMRGKRRLGATLRTPAMSFGTWLDKAKADLALLTTELPTGPYPLAGIPWFATPFGRDGIVTALEVNWLDPTLARGVLRYLAAEQAREQAPERDAEPGKILHEVREGEMAVLAEVPFRRYFGGVDSTPLFVVLAGAYARRTGDDALVDELWPSLLAAMRWIDERCARNPEGLLDYDRMRRTGLTNQGWKDSEDSVFHADGRPPHGAVALVEVQGYVYAARLAMAALAARRGDEIRAVRWRQLAERLREAVEDRYWMPERGFYALAVDGRGAACEVLTSNAGQLLWSGLPAPERAERVIERLRSADFNEGWGIRTLARGERNFNPMSYHNGSVWPHDTALCAAGMARYGHRQAAAQVLGELSNAASGFGGRVPELYCGFGRRAGEPVVGYPVACLPQAWSSGAVFLMLQACLGIAIDAWTRTIHIAQPALPAELGRLVVEGLDVAGERVSLVFERVGDRVAVAPLVPRSGAVKVLVHA
jgi:glycogen debranching enzyme